MVKEYMYADYCCEFCNEIFETKEEAAMHERTCDCRPENFPDLKKKWEGSWFEYCIDDHEEDEAWFYVQCIEIFTDEEGPAVKFRSIEVRRSKGMMHSYVDIDDVNDFFYGRLTGAHEVDGDDVRKRIVDVMNEWFC